MAEDRPGEGPITSPYGAKEGLGRASFRRPQKDHEGQRSDPTEWGASKKLAKDLGGDGPTKIEIQMVLEDNPRAVAAIRSAAEQKGRKLSDREIYEMLGNYR